MLALEHRHTALLLHVSLVCSGLQAVPGNAGVGVLDGGPAFAALVRQIGLIPIGHYLAHTAPG